MPINLANSYFGMGCALANAGETTAAKRNLKRAAKIYSEIGNIAWAGAALSAASELEPKGRGKRDAKSAIAMLRKSKSAFHLAMALIRFGEKYGDGRAIKNAERIINKHRYDFLKWRVRAFNARAAKGKSRLGHFRNMFATMLEDRQLTTSTTSRRAFLRDKHEALGEYLAHLLTTDSAMVEEALDVVTKSRSVTLIDELIAANPGGLSAESRGELERFREEVARETASDMNGTRRVSSSGYRITELSRRLLESELAPLKTSAAGATAVDSKVAVFADTSDGFYSIMAGKSHRLAIDHETVSSKVRRAEFELLSPMVGMADPGPALQVFLMILIQLLQKNMLMFANV
jgi:hypothetical protein